MNHDYGDPVSAQREWYSDAYSYETGPAWSGTPDGSVHAGVPLTAAAPGGWDPVEELAYLLQEAVPAEPSARVPPMRREPPSGVDFDEPLESLAGAQPPPRHSPAGHRKMQIRKGRLKWLQTGSFALVALVSVIVAMVSVFGGMVAYRPLQNITSGTGTGIAPSWPLLVYGPWMVASLSILRTALHQRRAVHSWFIVLLFSSVAMMLCVAQADKTFTGIAGATLPALASLACFQQLVRQITLTLPPRQATRRHRQ
ncbi:DUF2637 domain-containing protein [Streptomyces sp. NBC_00704]|uniref:DUF2637 domain-containing protein n=1 Tax=Streptomyces sp. NBC_00704 TaxID=2975809 RepID=UPI002E37F933|nr:DUF2637 domain-containing protein [Streptomyces sp. NBC_00704]